MGLLAIYAILVVVTSLVQHGSPTLLVIHADALARYLLAVPGALLAALALGRQAQRVRLEGHRQITLGLLMAAWSFALYGLTQVIVPPVDLFPASYLNSAAFTAWTGVPIQVVRAVLAVTATVGILRSIQAAEDERHHELAAAQQARLEALERVQQELEARESLRRELLRHIVIAQEEERSRIARELHDETAQFLTALMLDLATLRNSLPADRAITEIIERLQSLSRRMSQGIYRMVRDLRPAQLDDLGLAAALQHLVDQVRQRDGLEVRMSIEGPRRRLDLLVETALFRVAQEALTNVSRHAACQLAWLELHYHENEVTLCVRDDGKGFDPRQEILPPRGWGIAGMRERVESIGGSFRVHAAPGEGAQVEAIVPLKGQWSVEQEVGSDEPDPVNVGR